MHKLPVQGLSHGLAQQWPWLLQPYGLHGLEIFRFKVHALAVSINISIQGACARH